MLKSSIKELGRRQTILVHKHVTFYSFKFHDCWWKQIVKENLAQKHYINTNVNENKNTITKNARNTKKKFRNNTTNGSELQTHSTQIKAPFK